MRGHVFLSYNIFPQLLISTSYQHMSIVSIPPGKWPHPYLRTPNSMSRHCVAEQPPFERVLSVLAMWISVLLVEASTGLYVFHLKMERDGFYAR